MDDKSVFEPPKINLLHFAFFIHFILFGSFASYFWKTTHPFYPAAKYVLKWTGIALVLYHSIAFVLELGGFYFEPRFSRVLLYAFHIVLGSLCIAASMDAHKSPIKLLIGVIGIIGIINHIFQFYKNIK